MFGRPSPQSNRLSIIVIVVAALIILAVLKAAFSPQNQDAGSASTGSTGGTNRRWNGVSDKHSVGLRDLHPGAFAFMNHTMPPRVPSWIMQKQGHRNYTLYNLRRHEYHDWVRKEHQPVNFLFEEFVYTRDWDAFMKGGESRLHPTDIVVAVQSTPDRLPFVKRMLTQWKGPMALVIFIPDVAGSASAASCRSSTFEYIQNMNAGNTQPFALSFIYANERQLTLRCDIRNTSTGLEDSWWDEEALKKRYSGEKMKNYWNIYDGLYPINQARNTAINMVQTNAFVMLVDADFVLSGRAGHFYNELKSDVVLTRIRKGWEEKQAREVLVIPAFGRLRVNQHESPESSPCYPTTDDCWLYTDLDVPFTKPKLVELMGRGEVEPFYEGEFDLAYGCQKIREQWVPVSKDYEMQLLPDCEPFIVALKHSIPQFNPKFRGFQYDKLSHLQHLGILGTKFTMHPSLFIIHLPHSKTHQVDGFQTYKIATFDRWTALRVSFALTCQENKAAAVLEEELKKGTPEKEAKQFAWEAGDAMLTNVTDHLEGVLSYKFYPVKVVQDGIVG